MNITALGSWVESWGKTKTFGLPIPVGKCIRRVFRPAGLRAAEGAVAGAALGPLAPGGLSPPPAASGGAPARQRRPRHGPQPVATAAESGRGRGGCGRGGLHRQHGLQQALALRRPQRAHPGAETRLAWAPPTLPRLPPRLGQPPSCPGSAVPSTTPSQAPRPGLTPGLASRLSTRGPQNCRAPLFVPLSTNGSVTVGMLECFWLECFIFTKFPNIRDRVNALLTCNAWDAVGFCAPLPLLFLKPTS